MNRKCRFIYCYVKLRNKLIFALKLVLRLFIEAHMHFSRKSFKIFSPCYVKQGVLESEKNWRLLKACL